MWCKKLTALLCALMLLLGTASVQAENNDFAAFTKMPDTLTYQGGVVLQGYVKGADTTSDPLEVAYVMTSAPYIVLGQKTHWEVTIDGGSGDYSCEVVLAHQADLSLDEFADPWDCIDSFYLEGDSFTYTFTKPGRYFWAFYIMDDNGQFLVFQTRMYEVYTQADESAESTVAGKVNSIVNALITPEMSDYTRALVLHDWLIYNANYDYTYTHYDAAGVLLYGSGVCDSYARAYLMLCTAAGLECMIVTGTAGSESHAWNLVKVGGEWYHVDCTWDDPNEGGWERHDYFLVDDETMALDHRWNRQDDLIGDGGMLPPEAEGDPFWEPEDDDGSEQGAQFTFSAIDEFERQFDALVASGSHLPATTGKYTGSDWEAMFSAFDQWCQQKAQALANEGLVTTAGCQIQGNYFTIFLGWVDPTDFIRIDTEKLLLTIGEEYCLSPTDFHPLEDVFAWTSSDPQTVRIVPGFNSDPTDAIPDGPYALLTALKPGTVHITVTTTEDASDAVEVIVLPALAPEFNLKLETESNAVKLAWNAIPGVTEYRVYRRYQGQDVLLAVTTDTEAEIPSSKLPENVLQQVYVEGLRIVGGEAAASYTSDRITYGSMKPAYDTSLPQGLLAIGDEAFAGNTSLTAFDVPGAVTTIGARAFAGCSALTTVRLPASVRSIGDGAFDGCPLNCAQVVEGSYADTWMQIHYPDIILIY